MDRAAALARAEGAALQRSMAASASMGLVGVAFATASGSDAVLLDGAYSLVAFGMAWLARTLTPRLEAPGTEHFPFGLVALEPVFNVVRAGVVLLLLAFAAISAIGALSTGGDPTRAGPAVAYGLIVGAAGMAMARHQAERAMELNSELLRVDAASFRADGAISLSVGLAFVVSAVIGWSGWDELQPFVDPVMVLLLVALLVAEPWRVLRGASGELLAEAPPPEVRAQVDQAVVSALGDTRFEDRHVTVWKLGRRLEVRVTLLLADAEESMTVGELDLLRVQVHEALAALAPTVSVDVRFTADPRFMPTSSVGTTPPAALPAPQPSDEREPPERLQSTQSQGGAHGAGD